MSLVLVRHAQVEVDPGAPAHEWGLSSDGRSDAARLSRHPAVVAADLFFCSPEPKALATAAVMAEGRPIHQVEDLRELDRTAAGWIGSADEYAALVEAIFRNPRDSVRGCEAATSAAGRVVRAVEAILTEHVDRTVVIVSHGILLSLYMSCFRELDQPDFDIWRRLSFPDIAVLDPVQQTIVEDFSGIPVSW